MQSSSIARKLVAGAVALGVHAGVLAASDPGSDLASFVTRAVAVHPRVLAARADLDAGQAAVDAARRPLFNPELTIDAEHTDADNLAIGVSQTVDLGGKRLALETASRASRSSIEAGLAQVRQAVTVELLAALAAFETRRSVLNLSSIRHDLMAELDAQAGRRFEAGDLARVELDAVRLGLARARMESARHAADLLAAEQALGGYVQAPVSAYWPDLPQDVPQPAVAVDTAGLIGALPDVAGARHRLDAAVAEVDLRTRERRLDPTVSLSAGREDGHDLLQLGFSMPLPLRNRRIAEVARASSQRDRAQHSLDAIVMTARSALAGSTSRYRVLYGAWSEWRIMGRVGAEHRTGRLRQMWELGELNTTEYLLQLDQILDVEGTAVELKGEVWRAWFDWLLASGQVDAWLAAISEHAEE